MVHEFGAGKSRTVNSGPLLDVERGGTEGQVALYIARGLGQNGHHVLRGKRTVKQVAIGFGVVILMMALVQLVLAVLPFLLGIAGVVFLWIAIPRIIRTSFDIVNHDPLLFIPALQANAKHRVIPGVSWE
jgi:hypothetical protein